MRQTATQVFEMAKQPLKAKVRADQPEGRPKQVKRQASIVNDDPPADPPEGIDMKAITDDIKDTRETVLVSGSNGRLGKEVIRMLLKKGDVVRALVKKREYIVDLPAGVIPYIGDLNDENVLDQACDGVRTVMHFAAIVSEYRATTEELLRVNVDGTRNLLEASEKAKVDHFIYPSTVDVYGKRRKEILTEESELRPTDKYGHSKMLAEYVLEHYKASVPYTIFRMANLYGPGFEGPFFKILRAIKEQKAYLIGSGQNSMPLLHVYDAMRAFILAKNNSASKGKTYNLTDGINYTQEQLFAKAAELLHVPAPSQHISEIIVKVMAKKRGLDSDELRFLTSDRRVDISKVKNELGFSAMVTLDEGGGELVDKFLGRMQKAPPSLQI